jgi:hypothetical protein
MAIRSPSRSEWNDWKTQSARRGRQLSRHDLGSGARDPTHSGASQYGMVHV